MTHTGKQEMTVPYTGELAGMVLSFFPFFTFSSLSLGLSEHPFTPALYKLILISLYKLPVFKNTHILNIRYPVVQKPAKLTSSKQFASRCGAGHEN